MAEEEDRALVLEHLAVDRRIAKGVGVAAHALLGDLLQARALDGGVGATQILRPTAVAGLAAAVAPVGTSEHLRHQNARFHIVRFGHLLLLSRAPSLPGATALKLHDKLMPLHNNLFIESNPAPVKYALSLLGKIDEKLRLPMVPVTEPTRVAVRSAMVHAGLIN